ncbi:MAG TPA: hypothetical protein VGD71_28690 [Kribbella sp.]
MTATYATGRRRVRVWFGASAIADYIAPDEQAEQYAAAMARRFGGLRVTNDPFPDLPGPDELPPLR